MRSPRAPWWKTSLCPTPARASTPSWKSDRRNGNANDGARGTGAMNHDSYPEAYIRGILGQVKTIAMVGASANQARPSYFVLKYLAGRGYNMRPIHPGRAGGTIEGIKVYGSLAEAPGPIDMVDIFRNSEAAGAVVDEALALVPLPKVIWMQLTVRNDAAAARAEAKGGKAVMNAFQ